MALIGSPPASRVRCTDVRDTADFDLGRAWVSTRSRILGRRTSTRRLPRVNTPSPTPILSASSPSFAAPTNCPTRLVHARRQQRLVAGRLGDPYVAFHGASSKGSWRIRPPGFAERAGRRDGRHLSSTSPLENLSEGSVGHAFWPSISRRCEHPGKIVVIAVGNGDRFERLQSFTNVLHIPSKLLIGG